MTFNSRSRLSGLAPAYRARTGAMRAVAGLAALAIVGLQAWGLAAQDPTDSARPACLPVVVLPTVEIRAQRATDPSALASASSALGGSAVKLDF